MNYKTAYVLSLYLMILIQGISLSWAGSPPNPTASDVKGNTAGGTGALSKNTTSGGNTSFGFRSLFSNTVGSSNTATGYTTLFYNSTGGYNTANGSRALFSNTTGNANTANGFGTLRYNSIGGGNTATGYEALQFNEIGRENTASGYRAGYSNTWGDSNTVTGAEALYKNTKGSNNTVNGYQALHRSCCSDDNTVIGYKTLGNMISGRGNTAVGSFAGAGLVSGDFNIYIGGGPVVNHKESLTIRIGSEAYTRTFFGGIRGKTTGLTNAVPVVIDSNGQLGTINSSARFKKDIQDMNEDSRKILQLRPVTYHYKQASEDGNYPLEYGLIAEEVAKVYPDLVVYGTDGKVETVQYHKLTPMLVNEVKRLNTLLQKRCASPGNQQPETANDRHSSAI